MIALTVGYHTRGGEAFFVREPQSKNSCYHTRGGPSDTKEPGISYIRRAIPNKEISIIYCMLYHTHWGELSYKWTQRRSILYDDGHHKIRRDHHS